MDLTYTIRSFDDVNKVVLVDYDDGSWAEIRLTKPLPKTREDLEKIIKRFARPIESMLATIDPDADLSYISDLIGNTQTCSRFSVSKISEEPEEIDLELEANLKMWEELHFQQKVGEALVKLGVVAANPAIIPVSHA